MKGEQYITGVIIVLSLFIVVVFVILSYKILTDTEDEYFDSNSKSNRSDKMYNDNRKKNRSNRANKSVRFSDNISSSTANGSSGCSVCPKKYSYYNDNGIIVHRMSK